MSVQGCTLYVVYVSTGCLKKVKSNKVNFDPNFRGGVLPTSNSLFSFIFPSFLKFLCLSCCIYSEFSKTNNFQFQFLMDFRRVMAI